MDDKVKIDFNISNPGFLREIHRNVTVIVLEEEDGNLSIGWEEQPDSIHEYYTEVIDDDDT